MSLPVIRRAEQMQAPVHVSVAIVGAGACGLTAALMLSDAAVDCVVLERDALPSGSTAVSSGFVPAPCSRIQKAHGIEDSPQRFAQDIQAKAHGNAAPDLAVAYAAAIGPTLDALEAQHGLEFVLLDDFLYPGHSRHRMHAVPEKTGASLMARLQQAAATLDLPILTHAHVIELWLNAQDKVIGVAFERPDGSIETLGCDVLILSCNGFGGNPVLVQELLPEMKDAIYAGHTGNDGSAIAWGRALGARLADLGGYQGHGSWAIPQGALISWALMMEGAVQINALGQRFHNETQGYSEAAVHVLAQPESVAWNVFDEDLLRFARNFPDFCEAEAAGALKRCEDVMALSVLIGCNAEILGNTFNTITPGTQAPDGREFKRVLQKPFYAVKVTGALFHTQGGLDIDVNCHVLHEGGQPFDNLLAAGGAARGVSGNAVWGYLSGNGLLSAMAGGYIAARSAVNLLKALP